MQRQFVTPHILSSLFETKTRSMKTQNDIGESLSIIFRSNHAGK